MVVNAELTEENLVAELKIKAAMKKGAQLVTVNSSETALNKIADLWLDPKRGTNTALIAGIANALIRAEKIDRDFIARRTENFAAYQAAIAKLDRKKTAALTGLDGEKFDRIVAMLSAAPNLVVVYGMDQCLEKAPDDLKALGNLLLQLGKTGKAGNGLVLVRDYANAQGLLDMGVDPRYLPGFAAGDGAAIGRLSKLWGADLGPLFKPVDIREKLAKGAIKAALIFGEDPLAATAGADLLAGVEFKLVVDFFMTATASEADVVLPMSTPLESSGTFTACDRRVQRSEAILPPLAGMTNLEVIGKLAAKSGLKPAGADEIFREIGQANPFYLGVEMGGFWGRDLFKETFHTPGGKAKFLPVAVATDTCDGKKQPVLASENYIQFKIKSKLVL